MIAPKKRDPAATRQRIFEAAQRVFHEVGYDGATTREIARRADVNMALITRYFGSKKGLFQEAVIPFLDMRWAVEDGLDDLPEKLVRTYLNTAPWEDGFDPMVVFLRSASSAEAGPLLEAAMRDQIVRPLTDAIDGPNAQARAILLASQLGGLIVYFRILSQTPGDQEETAMRAYLLDYFQGLIEGNAAA